MKKAPAGWATNPAFVYIGRPGHGFEGYWGNPVQISSPDHKIECPVCGCYHFDRGSTLPCFEQYLVNRLQTDPEFNRRFYSELTGVTKVCFCKPKPCHGDIIEKYLSPLVDRIY